MPMIRGRISGRHPAEPEAEAAPAEQQIQIDPAQLSNVFAAPKWLRDLGFMSWLLFGIALLGVALIYLLALTQVIVGPVIVAAIVAAVASPLVAWMARHKIPRFAGTIIVMLGIVAVGFGMFLLIIGGITNETSAITGELSDAKDELGKWLGDIGIDQKTVDAAKQSADSGASDSFQTLLGGLLGAVGELSSLLFFLALTVLSLLFLLKDGPQIRHWAEGHLGLPEPVARMTSRRVLGSLRGYFLGVTIVAAFNAVVVTIGALILGVPLIGTIAAVTFIGAYIPYLGAWAAAGFSVLLALGGAGPEAAGGMIVVQLLANGILQQLVQPFAMGAALGIHPLAVLIVTIGGGALFGAVGLILAAPLTAAATRIAGDLAAAKAAEELEAAQAAAAVPGPEPPGGAPAPA